MKRLAIVVVFLLTAVNGARAQSIRGFGDAGLEVFTATKSFKAVFGQSNEPLFGGGLEFGFPNRMFLSVGAARMHRTGHRVFVFQDQVFTLNEAAEVTMTPLEFTGGYRFRSSGVVPYVGGGAGWLKYTETSPHAIGGDAVTISHSTYHALGGVEVPMSRWLAAAVEAQWTAVPNAFGTDPTSVGAVYNEHDLGGFTTRVKIVIGR
jgi:hypothetical protein